MTVTFAFKAFAKAIPCSTPFLATSDPSVLKRILAYIRGLPCSSNIFPVGARYYTRCRPRARRRWQRPGRHDGMGTADASESCPVSAIDPPEITHGRAGSRPTFAEKIIEFDLISSCPGGSEDRP